MIQSLIQDGYYRSPQGVDPESCARALALIRSTRAFGPALFLSEEEFDADPQYRGVNPQPGRNLYESYPTELGFVERDAGLVTMMNALLGPGYVSLHHKVVCGVPEQWIPEWLRSRILGNAVNNLGPYVRPEYRDLTYFYGIDYHQDIIDWKGREADFVTVYVYLHDVSEKDAPLHVLKGSHRLGATTFPHKLTLQPDGTWLYASDAGIETTCTDEKLLGPAGSIAWWHATTLHGTQPDTGDSERLSLRLLFARSETVVRCGLDDVNEAIGGELALMTTRVDLADDGSAVQRGNIINTTRETK